MRRKRKKSRLLSAILIIAILVLGYGVVTNLSNKTSNNTSINFLNNDEKKKAEEEKKKQEDEKKRIEEEKKKEEERVRLEQWKDTLTESIKADLETDLPRMGIVYYDTTNDQKIAINENKVFKAASTVKVQMNMIAYDWVKEGKLSLDEMLQYNSKKHYEAGTGILQGMDKSKPFPVQTLLDYSIQYSDNIATRMIMERLGGSKEVRRITNEVVGTDTDISENNITAEEEFRVLKRLFDNKENENYAHLIEDMKKTEFHNRIDKLIPQEITAHKIGDYATFVNDVAIVFHEKPYILVVYTDGIPHAADKIADLSKKIYDAHLQKYSK